MPWKKILSYLATFFAGVITGRLTKSDPVFENAENIGASQLELNGAMFLMVKVGIAAYLQAISATPEEIRSGRERAKAYLSVEIEKMGLPALKLFDVNGFIDFICDPTQLPKNSDELPPNVLRLTSDVGDWISKRMAADPEAAWKSQETVDLLKPVLRQWEREGRPDVQVRPLRHLIGAIVTAIE